MPPSAARPARWRELALARDRGGARGGPRADPGRRHRPLSPRAGARARRRCRAMPPASARRGGARSMPSSAAPGSARVLAELDPAGAARFAPGDTQRLIRAYEVVAATGRPLAEWQRGRAPRARLDVAAVVLLPPRDAALCRLRCAVLGDDRAAARRAEVQALLARGLAADLPAMKAVGVRELALWLARRAQPRAGRCRSAASDPALCQAAIHLVPAPPARDRPPSETRPRSAIFGKFIARNFFIYSSVSY